MQADGTRPLIWPLRDKLFGVAFVQQRPRWTGWRPIPILPTARPWDFLNRPNGRLFEAMRPVPVRTRPLPVHAQKPMPARMYAVSGVTRDSSGNVLGNCTLELYNTATNALVETATSNGSGNYQFKSAFANPAAHFVVAYKPGSPDVAGTTVNTLIAT